MPVSPVDIIASGAAVASLDLMTGGAYALVARTNRSYREATHVNLFSLVLLAAVVSTMKAAFVLFQAFRMPHWAESGHLLLSVDVVSSSIDLALALFCSRTIKTNFRSSEDNHSRLFFAALDYCKIVSLKGIITLALSFGLR